MTGWRHPEWYLDPLYRQGVSPSAKAPKGLVDQCVKRLANDLNTDVWKEKYGEVQNQSTYDGKYRFLYVSSKR